MTYNNWLAKAHRSRESAQLLNDAGDLVGAVNRAYYGMFYAAHAALAYLGVEAPSAKHGTLVSRFGQHLVEDGPSARSLGRWLNQALELRSVGDYADDPPDPSEADESPRRSIVFGSVYNRTGIVPANAKITIPMLNFASFLSFRVTLHVS